MSSSNEEISGLSSRLELEFILTQLRKIRSDITSEEVPNPSSMSSSKKYKISGLNGLELDLALAQLPKLSSSIVIEEMESDPTPTDTSFIGQLDNLIATLNSRANISLSSSISISGYYVLERFNIMRKGILCLHPQPTLNDAIITSRTIGSDKPWSNDNMYKHLAFLANCFIHRSQTSSQMVIDTFFFRSTAMVPPPQKLIVIQGNQISTVCPRVSKMDTISGVIDYTAIVADSTKVTNYTIIPPVVNQNYGGNMIAFFTAKVDAIVPGSLEDHLSQVVPQLVACAKHLRKSHIRGALTTGIKWHFIAVDLNADGDGAKYWVSEPIEWRTKQNPTSMNSECLVEGTSDECDPALIAGILSSWIQESSVEFNGDRFFQKPLSGGEVY